MRCWCQIRACEGGKQRKRTVRKYMWRNVTRAQVSNVGGKFNAVGRRFSALSARVLRVCERLYSLSREDAGRSEESEDNGTYFHTTTLRQRLILCHLSFWECRHFFRWLVAYYTPLVVRTLERASHTRHMRCRSLLLLEGSLGEILQLLW